VQQETAERLLLLQLVSVSKVTAVFTHWTQISDLQHQFLDWSSFFRKTVGLEEFKDNLYVGIINWSLKDVLRIRSTAQQSC